MKGVKKQVYRRLFNKWKPTLRSQKRKGQGKYKIDRGAETAIYDVLAEQAKAHSRRLVLKVYTFYDTSQTLLGPAVAIMSNFAKATHIWRFL